MCRYRVLMLFVLLAAAGCESVHNTPANVPLAGVDAQ